MGLFFTIEIWIIPTHCTFSRSHRDIDCIYLHFYGVCISLGMMWLHTFGDLMQTLLQSLVSFIRSSEYYFVNNA